LEGGVAGKKQWASNNYQNRSQYPSQPVAQTTGKGGLRPATQSQQNAHQGSPKPTPTKIQSKKTNE